MLLNPSYVYSCGLDSKIDWGHLKLTTLLPHSQICKCKVFMTIHMCTYIPVNGPGGDIVRDVWDVYVPVPAGELFDLQSEVPQGGGA